MNVSRCKIKHNSSSIVFFLLLLSLSQLSWASGFIIDWDNLNNGIQPESSDVYSIMSSVGQSVTGMMQGGGYILVGGYWTGYYKSGDLNCDGKVELGDVVFLISYLYKFGLPPCLWESGDVTCDQVINLGDLVYLISYLYRGGPPPIHCDP
jgi:hypothetical protein